MNFNPEIYHVLSFVVLVVLLVAIMNVPARGEDLQTSVSEVKPPVKVSMKGSEGWRTVSGEDLSLSSLKKVKVGDNGQLKLKSELDDEIKITENSQLDMDLNDRGPSNIDLDVGGINIDFNDETPRERRLTVETTNGVIGVRGTHFSILHNGNDLTSVAVFEGKVSVSNKHGQRIMLNRGEKIKIKNSELVERNDHSRSNQSSQKKTSLHEATWERWDTKNKLEDKKQEKRLLEFQSEQSDKFSGNEQSSLPEQQSIEVVNKRVDNLKNKLNRMNKQLKKISPDLNFTSSVKNIPELESTPGRKKQPEQHIESANGTVEDHVDQTDKPTDTVRNGQTPTDLTDKTNEPVESGLNIEPLDPKQLDFETTISSPDEIPE